MFNRMTTRAAICLVLVCLASGGAGGYLLRDQKTDGSTVLSVKDAMREEYFAPPDSFSRVNNTRNALEALSARLEVGITEGIVAYDRLARNSESEKRKAARVLERAIQAAEAARQEFEGTEQQLEITQSLLHALQKAGRYDRWTEVYLKALYEHPTHLVVSRFARDAVKNSQLAGQRQRVVEALSYLDAFPAEFAGKAEIEDALNSASPCYSQAQNSPPLPECAASQSAINWNRGRAIPTASHLRAMTTPKL